MKNIRIKQMLTLVLFACMFFILVEKEVRVVDLRQVDTVMYMEALENTINHGVPLSASNKTIRNAASMFGWGWKKICSTEHYYADDGVTNNILRNHAYYVVYLLAPLVYIFDVKHIAPAIHVFIYVLFAWLVFRLLFQSGLGSMYSLLFVVLVTLQPNFSLGLQGQYYFDRLFIPIGFILAYLLSKTTDGVYEHKRSILIIITMILAASIHERAALVAGLYMLAFAMFFHRKINRNNFILCTILGLTSVAYSIGITTTFTHDALPSNSSLYISALKSIASLGDIFSDPNKVGHIYIFVLVNMIIGVFGIFSRRYLLLAILIMLPNIIIWAPGAASKTGWLTHYHSYYFPFLVFAAAKGYSELISTDKLKMASVVIACFLSVISLYLIPYTGRFGLSLSAVHDNALVAAIEFLSTKNNSQKVFISYMNKLSESIPKGASVSTLEGFFPSLYKGRHLYHFPLGLDKADYIVLPNRGNSEQKPRFHTAVTYNGLDEQKLVDICMEDRLEKYGFDINNRKVIGYFSVIYKEDR